MAISEANGKSSTFTIKYNNRLPRQIVRGPCGADNQQLQCSSERKISSTRSTKKPVSALQS